MADIGSGEGPSVLDDYETLISTTDVELLKRAWRNEKAAPEILPFEASLVRRIKEQIDLAEENAEAFETDGVDPLTVSLYQMDLNRARFLLRSYLRIRLQKIEEYLFHILKYDAYRSRLSEQEQMFAERCEDDLKNHLDETVLSKLPENYQSRLKQSITSEEDDMDGAMMDDSSLAKCCTLSGILSLVCQKEASRFLGLGRSVFLDLDFYVKVPAPQLDSFVICKAKGYLSGMDFEPEYSMEIAEMERDLLTFVSYKFIKKPFEKGKIDLV